MRVGTALSINTEDGTVYGVVNELISPSSVKAIDAEGNEWQVDRGQGHKLNQQDGGIAEALRQQHGITVGPCQKETFGHDEVHVAEKQFAKLVKSGTPRKTTANRITPPPEFVAAY